MYTLNVAEAVAIMKSLSGLIVKINMLLEDPGIISSLERTETLVQSAREDIKIFKDITGEIPFGMLIFDDWENGRWGRDHIRTLEHSSSILSRQLNEHLINFDKGLKGEK